MHRVILVVVSGVLALAVVGVADAFQCPKLVGQINAAVGNRFDAAASEARTKAAEAEQLHKDGKHAESEKAAKDGLAKLGIQG